MSQNTDRADRLAEEQRLMRELGDRREFVRVEEAITSIHGVVGYLVSFSCNGYEPNGGAGALTRYHQVQLTCETNFPTAPPTVTFTPPIWHPDVASDGVYVLSASEWHDDKRLVDVCRVLYDLIRYKAPMRASQPAANPAAAAWVRANPERARVLDAQDFPLLVRTRIAHVTAPDDDGVAPGPVRSNAPAHTDDDPEPDPMLALNDYAREFVQVERKAGHSGGAREYEATFTARGITGRNARGGALFGNTHKVLVRVDAARAVTVKFLTPIFHPNLPETAKTLPWRPNPPRPPEEVFGWLYRRIRFQRCDLVNDVLNKNAAVWVHNTAQSREALNHVRAADAQTFPAPPGNQPEADRAIEAEPGRLAEVRGGRHENAATPPRNPAHPPAIRVGALQSAEAVPPRQGIRVLAPASPPPVEIVPATTGARGLSIGFTALVAYELRDLTRVEVVVPRGACAQMVDHARESDRREVEVAGFLMGTLERIPGRDADHPDFRVTVTDVLRARSRNQTVAEVEFGVEVWQELEAQSEPLERQGKVRLGWYHTHPNQGIFFSPPDLNSHLEWRQPHQFGLVIDPRNMECGLFHWLDYPPNVDDRRRLRNHISDPVLFALQPGPLPGSRGSYGPYGGSAGAGADAPPTRPEPPPREGAVRVVPPRPPLHRLRFWGAVGTVLTALCALGLFGGELLARARFPLSSQLLLALGTVSGLWLLARLWNAQFFHPAPAEAETEPDGDEDGELPARLLGVLLALAGVCAFGAAAEFLGKSPPPPVVMLLTLLFTAAAFAFLEMHLSGAFHGPGHTEQAVAAAVGRRTSETGATLRAGAGRTWRVAGKGLRAALPAIRWAFAIALVVTAGVVLTGVVFDLVRAQDWGGASLWFCGTLVLITCAMLCVYSRGTPHPGTPAPPGVLRINATDPLTANHPNQGDHDDGPRASTQQQ